MTPHGDSTLARLLRVAARDRRRDLFRAAVCGLAVTAATVLLLGLSGWFLTAAALAATIGTAHVFNYMLPAVGIRLLAIVRTGARYGERLYGHDAALGMLARIRPALFHAIASARPGRALGFTTGEASARLVQDVAVIEAAVVRRSAGWSLVGAMVSAGALAMLAGPATLGGVIAIIAVTIGASVLVARRMRAPARAALVVNGALKETLGHYGAAAAELRCYGIEAQAIAQIADHADLLAATNLEGADAASVLDLVQALSIVTAAGAAILLGHSAGAPIAAMAALAAAMGVDGAAPMIRDLAQRASVAAASERLDEILAPPPPRAVASNMAPERTTPSAPLLELAALGAERFRPGERVAVVGPSGCGKTTLAETLLGLRPAAPGQIRIDGIDIAGLAPARLHRIFALAPQDAHLLVGTVRDNLLLADPSADAQRLWQALEDAVLAVTVAALPDGLDSWIGENGACLSGGERRRLSLARALLSRAPWLVLDEPTEGLDPVTERALLARIEARLDTTGQGALIITHSARVRAFCDTIADMGASRDRSAPAPSHQLL